MSYYLRAVFQEPSTTTFRGRPCFRVTCSIAEAVNMTTKVFLHRRTLVEPGENGTADEFIAICSPFDLSTFPADAPTDNQDPPFFRKDSFDVLVPTVQSATEVIASAQQQLLLLTSLLRDLDNLNTVQNTWIPEEPPTTTVAP